jgi:hypothetical protein
MAAVADDTDVGYVIWGADHATYGPVELPTLVSWIKDERVTSETWIYIERTGCWEKATHVPELQMFFKGKGPCRAADSPPPAAGMVKAGALRRIKILGALSDAQLERFIDIMEVQKAPQWAQLVKQGDHGDAMYLVLEGELRVRMMVDDKEVILATLGVGEFFGEISLFDQGPRSADVIANTDSLLLKVCGNEFEKFAYEAPDLAAPFLLAVAKTLTTRIRADNKRYRDSITFTRASGR